MVVPLSLQLVKAISYKWGCCDRRSRRGRHDPSFSGNEFYLAKGVGWKNGKSGFCRLRKKKHDLKKADKARR